MLKRCETRLVTPHTHGHTDTRLTAHIHTHTHICSHLIEVHSGGGGALSDIKLQGVALEPHLSRPQL